MSHKKKFLLIGFALGLACIALYGAGTTINGARTILNSLILGTDNSAAGTLQIANGSANAHTIFSSGATTTNTIAGFSAVPTTGHIVTCTVSGTTCTLTDGGAPATGGMVLVEQHSASNSGSLDFTTCVSSTYDTYKITLTSIIPATNDAKIGFRFNTGSGFDSGSNYSWEAFYLGNAASGPNGSTSDTALSVTNDITNANSYQSLTGEYTLFAPQSDTLDKSIVGMTNGPFSGQGHNASMWLVSGYYKVATAVTQFQVLASSGNITSGTARCYGFAK